jgi:hypothetical protein
MQWVTQDQPDGALPLRNPPDPDDPNPRLQVPAYQLVPPKDPWHVAAPDPAAALSQAKAIGEPAPSPPLDPLPDETNPIDHDHRKPPGTDPANDKAMAKLKAIFDEIKRNASIKIAALNQGIVDFNVKKDRDTYDRARYAFLEFLDGLDNPHPKTDPKHRGSDWNGVTMKWASLEPVYGPCDFVVGLKVVVRWAGGSHSSAGTVQK